MTYTSGVDFTLTARHVVQSRWNVLGHVDGLWTGRLEISGLEPFTRYPFTVTQGARSNDGSTMTAPRKTDRFMLPFGTCQQNNATINEYRVEGYWAYVYEYAQTGDLPIPGIFWVDDYAYVDGRQVADQSNTGLFTTNRPDQSLDTDDYLMAWCSVFGMLGPAEVSLAFPASGSNAYVGLSRGMKRDWCRRNLNLYSNEGDHTYRNDMGWEVPSVGAGAYPNERWTSAGVDGPGKVAMDAFVGLMMPPRCHEVLDAPNDTNAYGWVCEFGPVTLATFDWVSNANGAIPWSISDPGYASDGLGGLIQVDTVAGLGQIADVLTLVNQYKNPYTLFGMAHHLRYPVSAYTDLYHTWSGAQHPIYDHCLPEFQRLITAEGQTPPSVMDGRYTNGANGTSIFLHGDYHMAFAYEFMAPAASGQRQEILYSIGVGTWDGSPNFARVDSNTFTAEGDVRANIKAQFLGEVGFLGDVAKPTFWGCMVEVDGSVSPVKVSVALKDSSNNTLREWTWHQYGGNLPTERAPAFAASPSPASE